MNLLSGTASLGDLFGLLLGFILLYVAETDWAVYVLVLTAFLLFSLGLLYRNVDECPV